MPVDCRTGDHPEHLVVSIDSASGRVLVTLVAASLTQVVRRM